MKIELSPEVKEELERLHSKLDLLLEKLEGPVQIDIDTSKLAATLRGHDYRTARTY